MMGILGGRTKALQNKILAVISSQSKHPFFSLATVLRGLAWLYQYVMVARNALYDARVLRTHRLPCAVISVGNLTVGGTGKTPLTIYLAGLILELGYRPVILSRGYKGRSEKEGAVVSDGRSILSDVRHAGDEPFLMAGLLQNVPVVIGSDRVRMGHIVIRQFDPDVIVLDDAFQHRRLYRDIDFLLMDERAPLGNAFMLPRGPLREPARALQRSHAIVLTRCQPKPADGWRQVAELAKPRPLFRAFHEPRMRGILPAGLGPESKNLIETHAAAAETVAGRRIVAFAGLACNATFWDTIGQLDGTLAYKLSFDDHHPYDMKDMQHICAMAHQYGDCLATTDKDFMRLPKGFRSTMPLLVLGIQIQFKEDPTALRQYLIRRLRHIVAERRTDFARKMDR